MIRQVRRLLHTQTVARGADPMAFTRKGDDKVNELREVRVAKFGLTAV